VAQELLEAEGLTCTVSDVDSEEDKGTVVDQDPEEGTELEKGGKVTIFVSNGSKKVTTVTVPSVIDMTMDDAVARLRDLGFKVSIQYEDGSDQEPDVVVDQSPKSGAEREKGSTITITVTRVPETTSTKKTTTTTKAPTTTTKKKTTTTTVEPSTTTTSTTVATTTT